MTFFTIQLSFEYHLKVEKDLCNNGFRIVWISLLTSHLDVKLVCLVMLVVLGKCGDNDIFYHTIIF